jgi:hypothetical protein
VKALRSAQHTRASTLGHRKTLGQNRVILPPPALDLFFFLGHHHREMPHTYPCWGRLRPRWATESLLSQLGWQWSASCVWVQFPLSLFKLCILQTNFIHPPTSPPLFHPLSSMTPFLKSASSKPGRWSNPRNLLPGKPVCGFTSHSAPLIFCPSNFYPTTPTSPPL